MKKIVIRTVTVKHRYCYETSVFYIPIKVFFISVMFFLLSNFNRIRMLPIGHRKRGDVLCGGGEMNGHT